jgi:hypothetical protein
MGHAQHHVVHVVLMPSHAGEQRAAAHGCPAIGLCCRESKEYINNLVPGAYMYSVDMQSHAVGGNSSHQSIPLSLHRLVRVPSISAPKENIDP